MRIVFTKLKTSKEFITVDFGDGNGPQKYAVEDARQNGMFRTAEKRERISDSVDQTSGMQRAARKTRSLQNFLKDLTI